MRPTHLYAAIGGALCLTITGFTITARIPREVTVAQVLSEALGPGQAIALPRAGLLHRETIPLGIRPGPTGTERMYMASVVTDSADSNRRLPILYFREVPENVRDQGAMRYFPAGLALKGTLRTLSDDDRERLQAELGDALGETTPSLYLADLDFNSLNPMLFAVGLGGAVALVYGLVGLVQSARAPLPGKRAATQAAAQRTPAGAGRRPKQVAQVECAACATAFPAYNNACPACKLPTTTEYLVSASPSLVDFEPLVPIFVHTLAVSDYQARQPLARPHTAVPYHPFEGFDEIGSADPPHRLVARPLESLVTAKALQAELSKRGEEAIVIGTDEIALGPFPRPVYAIGFDEDRLFYELEDAGGGTSAHELLWPAIGLVIGSSDRPLQSSLTVVQHVRKGGSADGRAGTHYAIDLFARDDATALRVVIPGTPRFDAPTLRAASRPEDQFGRLMDAIQERATNTYIQYLTGAYRGERSAWRLNLYARWRFLVGEQLGWERDDEAKGFPDYEIVELLGKGAMGAVYRARQVRLGRDVALKVISPALATTSDFVKRFKLEARAAASLSHPNIVAVIDQGEHKGRHYIAMEFIRGVSLKALLEQKGRLPEADVLEVGLGVARALEHAASKGVIHRDVKPDNIFMAHDGKVKLGDWGLAKSLEGDSSLTRTGLTVGTPYYMSPEQARASKKLDVRADVYSLGATLYHLVTGDPPFTGTSPADVVSQQLTKLAVDPRRRNPSISEPTSMLLLKMLAKDPAERPDPATLIELIDVMVGADQPPPGTPPPRQTMPKRRPVGASNGNSK